MKNNWINTTLLGLVVGMLAWGGNKGFDKMDTLNTSSIETKIQLTSLSSRVDGLASQISRMVTRDQLRGELDKRDAIISSLQRELSSLRHQLNSEP